MDKHFDPTSYESAWQKRWSESGVFRVERDPERETFTIMIPPPNVTGKLHMGHALQTALQDLLTRWQRMKGRDALWVPGTDHAGIATQMMVERELESEGSSRREVGREVFLERAWSWKKRYHGNIRSQLDLLGASCDWSRERFTLDEGMSMAVREAFVRLYREGLITRGDYMVNWSPQLETAISDLEVEMKPVAGKLYHIAYAIEGSDETIVVATTRPETMLGDTAIAVHPDDERYRHLLEGAAILPIVGRRLPFVADDHVDPEFGTGLVKITPHHDPADFEIGQRHDLPGITVIDRRGKMTQEAGEFAGLDRFEARKAVVERLTELGVLEKIEEHQHNVGHSERTGEPIEPLVSTQWFLDVSSMASAALEAQRDGRLRLVPDSWDKTWQHWLENIRPWCVSRQLWWGHRIPAWYDADGGVHVAMNEAEAAELAGTSDLRRDEDVLDTWFSSALWPFSTLGWPNEESEDLRAFYPTDVLVTGFDILFFWVARMVMTGLHFTGETPFSVVHLTGLVRDAEGRKMSKTRGNTVDPVDLIEEHGADALRFFLVSQDAPGRDIPLNPDQVAGYKAFGNKLWNAVRFALSRVGDSKVSLELDASELAAPERWILSRLTRTAREVGDRFERLRFDEACHHLYHFFWHEFCDWYLELSKPALMGEAPRPRVGEVVLTVLDQSLRLLHPVMPFLTEELWQRLPGHEAVHPDSICLAAYPEPVEGWEDTQVESQIEALIEVVTRVRAMRAELAIPPKDRLALHVKSEDGDRESFLADQTPLLAFLGRLSGVEVGEPPASACVDRVASVSIGLVAEGRDLAAEEKKRLNAELENVNQQIRGAEARLGNPSFVEKAPAAVVEGNRRKLAELEERRREIEAGLSRAES